MKTLVWLGEGKTISGVGLVSKGSTFTIDDQRARSFIKQKQAKLKTTSAVKTSDVESKKSEVK